jgi:5-methylcytosine-specific restriction endonuclease McrA
MNQESYQKRGEQRGIAIKKLITEGKTYKEISNELGVSISVVYYHSSEKQKKTWDDRQKIKRHSKNCPFTMKLRCFLRKKNDNKAKAILRRKLMSKLLGFIYPKKKGKVTPEMYTMLVKLVSQLEVNPTCYLTGDKIDIYDTRSYEFDHIIPKSRGGSNDLSNLGVCTAEANRAKADKTPEEFLALCKKVIAKLESPVT